MKEELDAIVGAYRALLAARRNELLEESLSRPRTAEQGIALLSALRPLRGLRFSPAAKSEETRSYHLTTA